MDKNLKEQNLENKYGRQMLLSNFGIEGQKKLMSAKVLVVGAGGLGCPVLQYLAGAGVGTIGIVDVDVVNEINLHRQILHTIENIGKNKAESAKQAIEHLNNDIIVKTYPFLLTADNISDIISEYDFVIDAVDNFETKYLINDACVCTKKAFCHGGVIQFHGQVHTYVPDQGPCIRCIFGDIPPKGTVPTCAQAGVIGPACGIIGCVQALEAIKYITSVGKLLTDSMYIFDGLTMTSRIARFPKASVNCKVCGPHADIKNVKKTGAVLHETSAIDESGKESH